MSNMKVLLKLCNRVIISIGLVFLTSSILNAQACPPKKDISQKHENAVSGFINLGFSIRDEDTKKLILDTFKVSITLPNYSLTIKKVTNGVASFTIPVEMMNDTITILIQGKNHQPRYLTLHNPKSIPTALLESQEKVQKEMQKQYRERMKRYKRKWWQKKRKRTWKGLGNPAF